MHAEFEKKEDNAKEWNAFASDEGGIWGPCLESSAKFSIYIKRWSNGANIPSNISSNMCNMVCSFDMLRLQRIFRRDYFRQATRLLKLLLIINNNAKKVNTLTDLVFIQYH